MKSIVCRDTGETYQEMLERLAKESGIQTSAKAGLVNFDRKRKGRLRRHGGLEARDAVYGNRARLKSEKGKKALLRARGELVERSLAHFLDRGGMGFRLARINEFHRKYLPGGKAGQVLFAGQKAEVQPILWVLRVEWQLLRGSRW